MRYLSVVILLLVFATGLQGCVGGDPEVGVLSPNKELALRLSVNDDGSLFYELAKGGEVILAPSKLGFSFQNHPPLDAFEIINFKLSSYDNVWTAVWGERKDIVDNHNALFVELREKKGERQINLRFRVYDDGIGFRYEFPQQKTLDSFVIMREMTEFNFDGDPTAWWIEADYNSYEKDYQTSALSNVQHVQTPLTVKTEKGTYVSIHEAALTDYASMTLKRTRDTGVEAELVPWADGTKVKASTPFQTPWRTVLVAEGTKQLIESDLVLNLNEPNKIQNTEWITPMKFMGIWWGIHLGVHTWQEGERHGATTERAKQYIDFASQNNIGGVLFEGWNKGWDKWGTREAYVVPTSDFDLEGVAQYAKERGITIVGHNETGGNVDAYESHVEEIFSLYSKLGINIVKTGYVAEQGFTNGEHHQGQWGVNHYRRIVKLAAKHKIMLNVHEPIKDTGIRRTWPNMMTREGAKGGEWNAWSKGNSASYTQVLPFTRLLAGPMDYTVGILDVDFSRFEGQRYDWWGQPQEMDTRVHTTLSHQLASIITLYSPLQMMADMLENYEGHPAFKFIRDYNPDIDDTRVLEGEVGEYVAIARRAGEEWYVGATTGSESRNLNVVLDFLSPNQSYIAEIYQDSMQTHCVNDPEAYDFIRVAVTSESVIPLHLAECGGAAVRLSPQP